jgi:hypothetical protein
MKKKIIAAKNHIWNYRGRYAAGATAVGMTYGVYKLAERNSEYLNEFLEEHGLSEEYYLSQQDRNAS